MGRPRADLSNHATVGGELLVSGLMFDTGVGGLYGLSAVYRDVVQNLDGLISSSIVLLPPRSCCGLRDRRTTGRRKGVRAHARPARPRWELALDHYPSSSWRPSDDV